MQTKHFILTAIIVVTISSCNNNKINMNQTAYKWPDSIAAPVCEKKPKELIAHGDTRIDNYFWLNDYFKKGPDSTKVVDYLTAENKYYDTIMSGTKPLQEKLYTEMKARIKEKDESVPVFKNGYYYYNRLEEGKDYFVYCRKKGALDAKEEVLLDVNKMAEGIDAVRTSLGHGTAFGIAGNGIALKDSFREAIYKAVDIINMRKEITTQYASPLKRRSAFVFKHAKDEAIPMEE
jgi:hypothetical protein